MYKTQFKGEVRKVQKDFKNQSVENNTQIYHNI